jgi:hypothetical protein
MIPLYDQMHTRVLLSRVLHCDDTGVTLRVPGCPRTTKAHLWAGIGDAGYPRHRHVTHHQVEPKLDRA